MTIEYQPTGYTPLPGDYVMLTLEDNPSSTIQGAFLGLDPKGTVHLLLEPDWDMSQSRQWSSAHLHATCVTHVQDQDVFPHTLRDFLAPLREQLERDES